MKQLSIITNLALFIFLSACDKNDTADSDGNSSGSSHADGARQEEIANKIMDSMGEFAKAISAVSDTKTARSTATKINGIGDQFSSMAKELEPLEVATEEMRESIHQKMDPHVTKQSGGLLVKHTAWFVALTVGVPLGVVYWAVYGVAAETLGGLNLPIGR